VGAEPRRRRSALERRRVVEETLWSARRFLNQLV